MKIKFKKNFPNYQLNPKKKIPFKHLYLIRTIKVNLEVSKNLKLNKKFNKINKKSLIKNFHWIKKVKSNYKKLKFKMSKRFKIETVKSI